MATVQSSSGRAPAKTLPRPRQPSYVLRLYVADQTLRSLNAIRNARAFCRKHLPGRCDLRVSDICRQPGLAARRQILAVPTLVRELPGPLMRIVGDLSNEPSVLAGLGLPPA